MLLALAASRLAGRRRFDRTRISPCPAHLLILLLSSRARIRNSLLTLNLLSFVYVLLQPLVVHVEVSHGFLFGPIRRPLEPGNELLVIHFQLVLDSLLFVLQLV